VKKTAKKLVAKETVRKLEEPVFGKVAGGISDPYPYQCVTWLCATTNGPFECANACAPDGPP
jgi:hypothetical protein